MQIILNWLVSAIVIFVVAYIIPGVTVAGFFTAVVLALVLGVINAFLKPILIILTLPITIITLGLFTLVINALLVMLAAFIVPGFDIDSFWWALLFAIALSLVNSFLHSLKKREERVSY